MILSCYVPGSRLIGRLLCFVKQTVRSVCKTCSSPGIDGIYLAPHSITADNMYNCVLGVGVS